jgi:hypothetical protein
MEGYPFSLVFQPNPFMCHTHSLQMPINSKWSIVALGHLHWPIQGPQSIESTFHSGPVQECITTHSLPYAQMQEMVMSRWCMPMHDQTELRSGDVVATTSIYILYVIIYTDFLQDFNTPLGCVNGSCQHGRNSHAANTVSHSTRNKYKQYGDPPSDQFIMTAISHYMWRYSLPIMMLVWDIQVLEYAMRRIPVYGRYGMWP